MRFHRFLKAVLLLTTSMAAQHTTLVKASYDPKTSTWCCTVKNLKHDWKDFHVRFPVVGSITTSSFTPINPPRTVGETWQTPGESVRGASGGKPRRGLVHFRIQKGCVPKGEERTFKIKFTSDLAVPRDAFLDWVLTNDGKTADESVFDKTNHPAVLDRQTHTGFKGKKRLVPDPYPVVVPHTEDKKYRDGRYIEYSVTHTGVAWKDFHVKFPIGDEDPKSFDTQTPDPTKWQDGMKQVKDEGGVRYLVVNYLVKAGECMEAFELETFAIKYRGTKTIDFKPGLTWSITNDGKSTDKDQVFDKTKAFVVDAVKFDSTRDYLAMLPGPKSTGRSCTTGVCIQCPSMRAEAHGSQRIGTKFGMGLANAPSNANLAFLALGPGGCSSSGLPLGFCEPLRVGLTGPGPIVVPMSLKRSSTTGCTAQALLTVLIPNDPRLVDQSTSYQWFVACGRSMSVTNCLTVRVYR